MLPIASALSSSLCWGLADFVGGLQSRRLPVFVVLLVSQGAALLAAMAVALLSGESLPPAGRVAAGMAAGAAGVLALACFYRALAIGTMSIVAPIAATGAVVPVIVGMASGDRPSGVQIAGMALAMAGVVLASREIHDDEQKAADARLAVTLALITALGFGLFFVGMERAASGGVLWALVSARVASVACVGLLTARSRPSFAGVRPALAPLVAIGLLDGAANGLYAFATTEGLLSVVAILGSLYPVVTILLARMVLGERVRRIQELGIAGAVAGVALIAAG